MEQRIKVGKKLFELCNSHPNPKPPEIAEVIFRYLESTKQGHSTKGYLECFGWEKRRFFRWKTRWTLEMTDCHLTVTSVSPLRSQVSENKGQNFSDCHLSVTSLSPAVTSVSPLRSQVPGNKGPNFSDCHLGVTTPEIQPDLGFGTDDAILREKKNNNNRGIVKGESLICLEEKKEEKRRKLSLATPPPYEDPSDQLSKEKIQTVLSQKSKSPSGKKRAYREGLVNFEDEWKHFASKHPYGRDIFDKWVETFENKVLANGNKYVNWSRAFRDWTNRNIVNRWFPFDLKKTERTPTAYSPYGLTTEEALAEIEQRCTGGAL